MLCPTCKKGELRWQKDAVKEFKVIEEGEKIKLKFIEFKDTYFDKDGYLYCSNDECFDDSSFNYGQCSDEFSEAYDKIYNRGEYV